MTKGFKFYFKNFSDILEKLHKIIFFQYLHILHLN